jgi:hypothetical protein
MLVHFGSIVVFETLISSSMFYVVLAMTAAINTHCVFFPMVSSFSGAGKLGQRGLPFFETIGQLDARFDCTFDVYADMVGQWPTQCVLVWGLLFPARFFDRGATKPFKEIQTRYNVFIFGAVLGVFSFFFFSSFLFSISLFFSLSLFSSQPLTVWIIHSQYWKRRTWRKLTRTWAAPLMECCAPACILTVHGGITTTNMCVIQDRLKILRCCQ